MEDATVNPSSSKTRVHDRLPSTVDQGNVSAGGDHEKGIELEKQRSSATAPLAKEQANGTVKPSFLGEILAHVDGVPVYELMKEQVGKDHMDVVKDTMSKNQQTTHGKGVDLEQ